MRTEAGGRKDRVWREFCPYSGQDWWVEPSRQWSSSVRPMSRLVWLVWLVGGDDLLESRYGRKKDIGWWRGLRPVVAKSMAATSIGVIVGVGRVG